MVYVLFLVGLVLICKGGDWFVDASSHLAKALGIPKYVIGATIVSFATTMPEMIVSVVAALSGRSGMAIGNAIGSVSANTGVILGISLFFLPVAVQTRDYLMKTILYIGTLILLLVSFCDHIFTAADSVLLLFAGILFMLANTHNAIKTMRSGRESVGEKKIFKNFLWFFIGAAAVAAGSEVLIFSACEIAQRLHVSEDIISVTILAMGTSLPELVTTITAIVKKESSLSVGNIVGANMIDSAFILPVCTLLTGEELPVSAQMAGIDMPICLLLGATALFPMLFRGRIKRRDGAVVMLIYGIYLICICGGSAGA